MRPTISNLSARNAAFNCRPAQPDWSDFTSLVLGGCVDTSARDYDGTCIEGGKSRAEAEFFTIYGELAAGGYQILTDSPDFDAAQRIAADLCYFSGLTLKVEC
ncbi:hypothetical protein [Agrobacterium sp. V1]|uniref:hypothetical protein n=1 Tax=Agrobacterium sp. V1 TaxID=3061957 RepID=UPI002672B302|nr:hypothetical protein [Agrobacterium sp. V1]MDO3445473.1 hypothetical protein [Agrobacterium sp. V1]